VITAAPAFAEGYLESAPGTAVVSQATPSWSGGYVGANISWGNGSVDGAGELGELLSAFGLSSTFSEPSGTTGAIRGGYDWESNGAIFGVGAEYSFGEYDGGLEGVYREVAEEEGLGDLTFGLEQMGTIFARAGFLASDEVMIYGLLGYSWADGNLSLDGDSVSQSMDGYTLGVGGEYLFSQNWSAFGEYAYTDFGTVEDTEGLLEADIGLFKMGLNYRF
jgi:outer membrane immunogenic protein